MKADYQQFFTTQQSAHHNLAAILMRHAQSTFQKPIAQHQYQAFSLIDYFVKKNDRPIIIDSGCGTGLSSAILAEKFSDHVVIGIDKSKARLKRAAHTPPNCLLVQGNLIDLWRLMAASPLPIVRHYLLYPNPWPKASQVTRRFHAHPIFRTMIGLAPYFELRCNWNIYAEEIMIALKTLGQKPILAKKSDKEYMTLFEKKYIESGCDIYIINNCLV